MFGIALLFSTAAIAPAQDMCPSLTVSPSTSEKGKASFSAMLSGGDGKVQPTFNWSVSAGTISAGQGTVSISVEAEPGENVTGTVEIGGYAPECPMINSATTEISAVADSQCPVLGVQQYRGPNSETIFEASADPGVEGDEILIHWWVSTPGTIIKGQSTASIEVSGPKGETITAVLNVTGLPPACKGRAAGDFRIQ